MSDRITELGDVETGDQIEVGSRSATVVEVVEGGGLGGPRPHMVVEYEHGDGETRTVEESALGAMNVRRNSR